MNQHRDYSHSALATLNFDDGILTWGGRKVSEIAANLGRTPFYSYDLSSIGRRVAELRTHLPEGMELHYAMKANPMPEIVKFLVGLVDGLDVASAGELAVALQTDVDPSTVSFAGPGKRDSELRDAVIAGITVNLESESEMNRLVRIGNEEGIQPRVAIRVNPQFELKSSGMKMGGRPSPFGVDSERVPTMLENLRSLDLDFRGFHVYSGSQNLRAESIDESMSKTVELVIELASGSALDVSVVNLGGGLGIPYFPKERSIDLEALSDPAERAVSRLKEMLGNCDVVMELGRFLVGEAGIYVCKVLDIKESRGLKYVVTDGGLHHHLAASGNFGQVIRKNYPITAVSRAESSEEVTIVGPLCTPLDLLGDRVTIDRVEVGSLIAILQSGAYGKTASPEMFLSHPPCPEVVI